MTEGQHADQSVVDDVDPRVLPDEKLRALSRVWHLGAHVEFDLLGVVPMVGRVIAQTLTHVTLDTSNNGGGLHRTTLSWASIDAAMAADQARAAAARPAPIRTANVLIDLPSDVFRRFTSGDVRTD